MSSLEDQVRAAVRAAAAEIGPGDVPPMRPIGSGAGAGGPSAGRRRAREDGGRGPVWHWGAPLAAAAAVVAVIAAGGLLGRVALSHSPRPLASPAKPAARHAKAAPAYPPDLVAGLTGLFVPASGAQFSTGALFMGEYRVLEAKAENLCMEKLGFPGTPVPTPAAFASGFWDLTQFPDLNAIAKAGTMPGDDVLGARPQAAGSKAYQAAGSQCSTAANALFRPMIRAAEKLTDGWGLIVMNIQSSPAVLATMPAVRSCAMRYGWPSGPYVPTRPMNSFADFVDWVAGQLDGAGSRGASAAQMRALGRHWAPIFVQCARPAVTVMERQQLAAQRIFLRERQRQFDALVSVAKADFAAAERQTRLLPLAMAR
jgi:hypothetical protein